jgi:hypothetical protein
MPAPAAVGTVAGMNPLSLPFTCVVRGVAFRQQDVILCAVGDPVRIVREPDNPEDVNACAVYGSRREMLGYIPAKVALRLAAGGATAWRGRITDVRPGDVWGLDVYVESEVPTTPPVPAAAPEPVEQEPAPQVFSRSQRLLGRLERRDGDTVYVRDPSGRTVPFPASLIAG